MLLLVVLSLMGWQGLLAQNRPISGKVSAEDGGALASASVVIKGTSRGVLTDDDGAFAISAATGEVLVVSYIGYETREQVIGTESSYAIVLVESMASTEEIVLVGYGTQQRAKVTGAIGTVDVRELNDLPVYSVEQGLQGRVAGVSVQQVSGAPGAAFRVNIRGVGTTGDNEPLYVIDGYPVPVGTQGDFSTSPLARINPNDIESITVLKDASAAAIYGALAANGVVIITTKRGQAGAPKVNFSGYAGVQQVWRRLELLGERDYVEFVNEKYRNDPNATIPDDIPANLRDVNNLPGNNTDWQEELFRTAPIQDYNVDISGGTENARFSVGAGYLNQEGTMLGTSFERYTVKVNSDYKLGKRIRVGQSMILAYSEKFTEGNSGGRRQIEHVIKQPATIPVLSDAFEGGYGWPVTDDGQDAENPVAIAYLNTNRGRDYSVLGSLFGEVDIVKGLTYRINVGMNFGIGNGYSYNPSYEATRNLLRFSQLSESYNTTFVPLIEHTLTYQESFGKHNLTVLAGQTDQSFRFTGMSGRVEQLPNNQVFALGLGLNPTVNSYLVEERLRSFIGRFAYDFDGKYLINATLRYDGSSKLSPENRFDIFPSVSLGWRAINEGFMENVTFLSDLKLRFSYGQVGNVKTLGAYNTANLNSAANYNFGAQLAVGVAPGGLVNPDLRWERGTTTNIGVDLGFLKNRLTVVADYYIRDTRDWILYVLLPNSTGLGGVFENTGLVRNSGFELAASWKKLEGDFTYSLNANVATLRNEVISLGNGEPIAGGGTFSLGLLTRTDEGHPVGSYYGWVVDGIFQTQTEVDAANNLDGDPTTPYQPGAAPGDLRFRDIAGPNDDEGNPTPPDGQITADDRDYIGSPIPKFIYGGTANFAYKGIDLSINVQGMAGHYVWNALRTWTEDLSQNFNQGAAVLDRWQQAGDDTDVPRAINGDPNNNKRNSDRFIEKGNFTRVKNVTLGYTVPVDGISWLGNARIYVTSNNFLTFTRYSGMDPEVGGDNATLGRGIDIGTYPQARTYVVGVQLGF
ncbi:MAG: TonB-dependent receptor [Bacteroidia bacterium]